MNKLILASLLVVALLALVGANDVAARSGRRVSNRGELRKGNRGRLVSLTAANTQFKGNGTCAIFSLKYR